MSLTCSTQRAILRLKAKGNFFLYLYNSGECFFYFHSSHKRSRKGIGKYKLVMKSMYHRRETIKSSSGVKELENRLFKCNDLGFQTIHITMLEINLFVRPWELLQGRNISLEFKLCKTNTPTWPFDPEQTSNNSVRFVLKKS